MSSRTLVLFDFDGTLTRSDTLFAFTRFAVGDVRFFFGLGYLAIPMALQKLKLLSAQRTKELFLSHFFKGISQDSFLNFCSLFTQNLLPQLIRTQAREQILTYQKLNSRMVIVSASPQDWIVNWAAQYGIEVIATQLQIQDSKITGRIAGINCNGQEKVNRIREKIQLADYTHIIVYGDSSGDYPMLELATEKHFKPFRDKK